MNIFWDLYQNQNIEQASQTANTATGKAERAQQKTYELERKLQRLSLASQAMWELLQDRLGISDEDIGNKMLEVDLRDGRADGKISQTIVHCPSCQRKVNSTRYMCFYCGADVPKRNVFE